METPIFKSYVKHQKVCVICFEDFLAPQQDDVPVPTSPVASPEGLGPEETSLDGTWIWENIPMAGKFQRFSGR